VRDLLLRAKHLFVAASWSPMGATALTQRSPLGACGAVWLPLIALVAGGCTGGLPTTRQVAPKVVA
jgi:hypothetical protein